MIIEAASADQALLLLERDGCAFDCVFSDIQMPGRTDGLDLARWIRRHRPGLPVLLASGNVRADDLEPELRAVVPVISKPYRGQAIETQIAALIAGAQPGLFETAGNVLDKCSHSSASAGTFASPAKLGILPPSYPWEVDSLSPAVARAKAKRHRTGKARSN